MKVGLVGTHATESEGRPADDELSSLAGALAASGVDVTVYSCRPDGAGRDSDVDDLGYRVVYMPGPGPSDAELAPAMGDFARFLSSQWEADRPDVVNASTWIYGVATQLAADHHGVASVQSLPQLSSAVHRRQDRQIGPVTRLRFERLLARSATRAVVSCTEDVADLVRLGCPRTRVSVLPQAVDMEHFSPVGDADDRHMETRVVSIARELLPHKGLDDLVCALPRLPSTELVVIGGVGSDDPGAARLRTLATELGVADRLRLTGPIAREDLPRMLRSADAFAFPSWYEPFGLPVVEAMACGVPVVASEAGGMLDTVIHDVTGVHVPARDPVRLAKALAEVLHGGVLRSGMGLSGRARARSRYSWEGVAAEARSIYERAIDGQSGAAQPGRRPTAARSAVGAAGYGRGRSTACVVSPSGEEARLG
jgi:glycosyltransferase involved in cell wall biosynthesis